MRKQCESTFLSFSEQGYRVLAVAYRTLGRKDAYHIANEKELVLAGLLAFFDPPLHGVPEVIEALRSEGVLIKVITGDNHLVARHVCKEVGFDTSRILTGDKLEHITDPTLGLATSETT